MALNVHILKIVLASFVIFFQLPVIQFLDSELKYNLGCKSQENSEPFQSE